ncbi:MAG: YlxM family DNA-binding protein [Lachnospiraceae bacterium]|nr:YlxM family DNA-binding protein [Lachnospiraceae bacterium]
MGPEKIVKQNILYDFYGELLTEHQRQIYEDAIFNDLSLSEISEQYGITRQGAHDIIKRCDRALEGYEEKLHLAEKFETVKNCALELKLLISEQGGNKSLTELNSRTDPGLNRALELTDAIINTI